MKGKIKVLLLAVVVVALVGLGPGGSLLSDRLAFAEPSTPTPNNGTFQGCGGFGPGGMMGGLGMWGRGSYNQVTLDKISKMIGIPTQDIVSRLQAGESLVDIAQGKATEQQLIDTILAFQKDALALRVKYGYITQDQANTMLQQMQQAAKTFVESKGQGGLGPRLGPQGGSSGPGVGPGQRSGYGGMMGGYGGSGIAGGYGGMMGGYQ